MTALVNRIIDYSKVDGPGCRTAIVFQGCNYRCRYCHSPDTMGTCDGCGICVLSCPTGALRPQKGRTPLVDDSVCFPVWDERKCDDCGICVNVCAKDASPKIRRMTVKEVLDRIKKNLPAIEGITCTGGECLLQGEFISELFPRAKKLAAAEGKNLSCLIDTNGSLFIKKPDSPFGVFDSLLDVEAFPGLIDCCDGVMLDIKAWEEGAHRELTGCGNGAVLKAARFLAERGKLFEVRTVVCKNDESAACTVEKAAALLAPCLEIADIRYRLIPFRVFGVRKEYRKMGAPTREKMRELRRLILDKGFTTVTIS